MDKSQTQNSNGTILNKIARNVLIFLSPKIFWPVYGYWLTLIGLIILQDRGITDSLLGLPDWVTSIRPEMYDKVPLECFVAIPIFFAATIFMVFWYVCAENTNLFLYTVLHLLLVIILSPTVIDYIFLAVAY